MRLGLCAPLLACAVLALPSAEASVDEAWMEVQEVLSAPEGRSIQEPIDELIESAREIDVHRLTSQASALVVWSQINPDAGDGVLEAAVRLDRELPTSYFLLARRSWHRGDRLDAAARYLRGWLALVQHEVTWRHLLRSIAIWLVIGIAVAAAVTMVVMTLRTLRRSTHDAMVVGRIVFERANSIVFGLVLLLLPLLAGLGPVWLLVYLFVIGWVYLDRTQRLVAVMCCLVLAATPSVLETLQRSLLRSPAVTERVGVALDERQLAPATLREFLNLKDSFEGDSLYHLILGEMLRMHSAVESAKIEFQTASLEHLGDARPFVILGNMALEDGDAQLAIQNYDEAINTDGRTALAYHNLSSAYDLVRRFQQGDAARARARELAGGRSAALGVRGRDPRVRYPEITSDDVDEFVAGLTDEQRLEVGRSTVSLRPLRQLLTPSAMVFWVTGLFGLLLLGVRLKWFSGARECAKCGKIYRLDDEPGESAVYCRQCVSVFLQRDLVPIDQQTAKIAQVRRWDRLSTVARRLSSVIAPGSYQVVGDRVVFGVVIGVLAWVAVIGVVVWVPRFVEVIEPMLPVLPVVVMLWVLVAAVWVRSFVASWQRR